jgi:hypothetical protein
MKIKFTIYLLLFAVTACKTSNVEIDPDIKMKDLYGKWAWIKSSGGLTGQIITPASTGNNDMLDISSNIIKKFRNGHLLVQYPYQVKKSASIIDKRLYYQLVPVNGGLIQSITMLRNDTLVLSDEAYDGYGFTYVRQK